MNEADLRQQIENLTDLLAVSREIGATIELEPLLKRIEQAALHVLDCERATVFLYDRVHDELHSKLATGEAEIRFSAKLGIAGEAAQSRRVVNVPDAYADERFNPDVDKRTGYRTRNILAFALTGYDGEVMGVLQVLNKRGGPFTSSDETLAATLSSLTGVALQRQLLLEQYAEKQKLERDLAIAREIQQSLLPERDPSVDGYDIAGWNRPADDTGGDCYDFVPLPDGRLGLLIADATGHGIGPALIAAELRALLRAAAATTGDLSTIVGRCNEQLVADLDSGRFVTTFFGMLDPAAARIDYISGGHGPLMVYRAADASREVLRATTVPLGILPGIDMTPAPPVVLAPGDIFLVVTDGFFEWENTEGEAFGTDRIFDIVHEHHDRSAAEMIAIMHDAVSEFGRLTGQDDDLTAVLVRRR
jgi:phosphoserine phosphatase